MRKSLFLSLAPLFLFTVAIAQTPPEREPGQRQGGEGRRAVRGGERGERAQRPPMFEMLSRRLAETLELDEQQQQMFDAIAAEHQAKMAASGDPGREMGELMREMREAREAGDSARMAEIEAELGAFRDAANAMRDAFIEQVEPILRPDQKERLAEFRERMAQRGPGGMGGPGGLGGPGGRGGPGGPGGQARMLDQLKQELNLDEEQAARFDELAAGMREQMRQGRGGNDAVRGLREQLREAREAGDEQQVEMLQRQLAELGGDPRAMMNEFYAQLESILSPEQKQKLAAARERLDRGREGPGQDAVRGMFRVVRRLNLDDDQAAELREIEREARGAQGGGRGEGRDRRNAGASAEEMKNRILEILTPEQAQEFERQLAELDRGNRDRGNRERGGRERPGQRGAGGRP